MKATNNTVFQVFEVFLSQDRFVKACSFAMFFLLILNERLETSWLKDIAIVLGIIGLVAHYLNLPKEKHSTFFGSILLIVAFLGALLALFYYFSG